MNQVVARYQDGNLVKGNTLDFAPAKAVFHLTPADDTAKMLAVTTSELKALFFVRDLAGDPDHQEGGHFPEGCRAYGHRIIVTFTDGEVLAGYASDYNLKRPGFFFTPADPQSNNLRMFVVSGAVKNVEPVEQPAAMRQAATVIW